jgi:hypothetical protein
MKVKVTLDLIMNIPGEFQDDFQAVDLIDQTLRDMLYVGVDSDDSEEDINDLPIDDLTIRMYKVLSGRILTS